MAEPYTGEIRLFAGNFAPTNWAFCAGQVLPVGGNEALFSLLGNAYGGDGRSNFALPDLRGRVPIHQGNGPGLTSRQLGEKGGASEVTLTMAQYPAHTHRIGAHTATSAAPPYVAALLAGNTVKVYGPPTGGSAEPFPTTMSDKAIGASQARGLAHNNMAPSLGINYIIALSGIYPSMY